MDDLKKNLFTIVCVLVFVSMIGLYAIQVYPTYAANDKKVVQLKKKNDTLQRYLQDRESLPTSKDIEAWSRHGREYVEAFESVREMLQRREEGFEGVYLKGSLRSGTGESYDHPNPRLAGLTVKGIQFNNLGFSTAVEDHYKRLVEYARENGIEFHRAKEEPPQKVFYHETISKRNFTPEEVNRAQKEVWLQDELVDIFAGTGVARIHRFSFQQPDPRAQVQRRAPQGQAEPVGPFVKDHPFYSNFILTAKFDVDFKKLPDVLKRILESDRTFFIRTIDVRRYEKNDPEAAQEEGLKIRPDFKPVQVELGLEAIDWHIKPLEEYVENVPGGEQQGS